MKIINTRLVWALMVLSLVGSVISCEPEGKDDMDGKGVSLIRFSNLSDPDNAFSLVAFNAVKETNPIVSINRDATSAADLQATTSVDFSVDQTILDSYNANNAPTDVDFTLLPASTYTLVGLTGSTFSFGAGEFAKDISMTLDPATLDFSKSYALPVRLSNPGGSYKLSDGASSVLIQVIVKNAYDGVYSMGGSMGRYDATTGAPLNDGLDGPMKAGLTTNVRTAGAKTDIFTMYWASGGGVGGVGLTASPRITVNADNTIVLDIVDGGATPANWGPIPGMPNNYDPATQTFTINWKWGATDGGSPTGTTRAMYYKLKWLKPR